MNDDPVIEMRPTRASSKGFWDRHAKLSILLIAGVFYVILIGMCLVIGVLIWQS